MQNSIEDYIENHRDVLDVETPDDEKIWKGISTELGKSRRLRIWGFRVAAVILVMVTSGVFITYVMHQRKGGVKNYSLLNVSKELGDEENYFHLTIHRKMKEVQQSGSLGEPYYSMITQLRQVDRQVETYMSDIQELGNQPKILNGIIRCYELKIRIIEKTLKEIEKNKHYENEKHIL